MSIYRCYVHLPNQKVAKFLSVKEQALNKRFPIYSDPLVPTQCSLCLVLPLLALPYLARYELSRLLLQLRTCPS